MRPWIAVLTLLVCSPLAAEQIYRYVDEEGNVVFTDEPRPGAEPVKLGPLNTVNTPEPAPTKPRTGKAEPDQGAQAYRTVRLQGPPDESVLRQQSGFDVSLELEPPLQTREGHQASLIVNGEEYARGPQTVWQLRDLDRGSYAVQGVILGSGGRQVASSNTLNVTIKRTSALQPRGPSVPGGAPSAGGAGSVSGPTSPGGASSAGGAP